MIFDEMVSKSNMFFLGMLSCIMTYVNGTLRITKQRNSLNVDFIVMYLTLNPNHFKVVETTEVYAASDVDIDTFVCLFDCQRTSFP